MGPQNKNATTRRIEERLAEIVNRCDPDQTAKRFSTSGRCGNEGLFRFCMHMKEELFHLQKAMPYIKQWHERWQGKLIDETGYKLSLEDIEVMAEGLWDKIKYKVGGELAAAKANAKKRYDETIPELDGYGGKPAKLLALVCFELQRAVGKDTPFFISGYDAAEVMGLDKIKGQKRGDRTLKVFIRKGIIRLVERGNRRRANRFYYTGSPPTEAY